MAHWFSVDDANTYLTVQLGDEGAEDEDAIKVVTAAVDQSGSMCGGAINNVNEVLKDIYQRGSIDIKLLCYNTAIQRKTLADVTASPLVAGYRTNFTIVFEELSREVKALSSKAKEEKKSGSLTVIFMTDGEDTESRPADLEKAIKKFQLQCKAVKNTVEVVVHVIGFGSDVKKDFLERVQTLGNKPGLFKYSTASKELGKDFDEMFAFAESAREYRFAWNGATHTAHGTAAGFSVLLPTPPEDVAELEVAWDKVGVKFPLSKLEKPSPIDQAKAISLLSPDDEPDVRDVMARINGVQTTGGLLERMEIEQIKKEVMERMMEFLELFTEMREDEVPEKVQSRLKALRSGAVFADVGRKAKLQRRINKNTEYFVKTDINGILTEWKKNMTAESWAEIDALKKEWTCALSEIDVFEMMQGTVLDFMCVPILVERNEEAIDTPSRGLKLKSVGSSVITYDSFIKLREETIAKLTADGADATQLHDPECVIPATGEKVNAVMPLYIHSDHMMRIRRMEGIWLGHMYTLDSYGYDKTQEVGLINLYYHMIQQSNGTTRNAHILREVDKVCQFIVSESEGFKTIFGASTMDNLLGNIALRDAPILGDLVLPFMIAFLNGPKSLMEVIPALYLVHTRRHVQKTINKKDRDGVVKMLLYGEGKTKIVKRDTTTGAVSSKTSFEFLEEGYANFFHDEHKAPIPIVKEESNQTERKEIVAADPEYIDTLLPDTPAFLLWMFEHLDIDPGVIKETIDYEQMRKDLVAVLSFAAIPTGIDSTNVLTRVDEIHQSSEENVTTYDTSEEALRSIVYVATNAKTIDGFCGVLMKYCPRRAGVFFDAIVTKLISEPNKCQLAKEKLVVLLTNHTPESFKEVYPQLEERKICWQPRFPRRDLVAVVGEEKLDEIEDEMMGEVGAPYNRNPHTGQYVGTLLSGSWTLHRYRESNKANHQGHSNHNPNLEFVFPFRGYNSWN